MSYEKYVPVNSNDGMDTETSERGAPEAQGLELICMTFQVATTDWTLSLVHPVQGTPRAQGL